MMDHHGDMTKVNIAPAKAKLSALVNKALRGEQVVLCKNGTPVVRLVPVHPFSEKDPCRPIPELAVHVGAEALQPLDEADWGELGK
jgi:prevent-host-death family protein